MLEQLIAQVQDRKTISRVRSMQTILNEENSRLSERFASELEAATFTPVFFSWLSRETCLFHEIARVIWCVWWRQPKTRSMLGQRRTRWPNIEPALGVRHLFTVVPLTSPTKMSHSDVRWRNTSLPNLEGVTQSGQLPRWQVSSSSQPHLSMHCFVLCILQRSI